MDRSDRLQEVLRQKSWESKAFEDPFSPPPLDLPGVVKMALTVSHDSGLEPPKPAVYGRGQLRSAELFFEAGR